MKCFVLFVYLFVYRVGKLANSQMDILPIQSSSLKGQKLKQDMKKNIITPGNYNTPIFSRLNEIATIKFNTGVSIFTKNLNSTFPLGIKCMLCLIYELKRCLEFICRKPS